MPEKNNGFDGNVSQLNKPAGEPTDETFHGLTVLEDVEHPLVPEVTHSYYDPKKDSGCSLQEEVAMTIEDNDFGTLMIGETGVGKDCLAKYICMKTNRPMVRLNFGVDVTYDELVGHYAPDGDGDFTFQYGILSQAVRNGWMFVADEINAASGEATMPLHGITEDEQNRELTIRETGEVVDPHPEFKFVATMNPLGYAGTKDLNSAFKGRFYPVEVPNMDLEDEQDLIVEKSDMDSTNARTIVNIANKLRNARKEGDIMTPVSTRDLIKIGKMQKIMGLKEATKRVFSGIAKDHDERAINKVIDTHLS